MIKGTVLRDAIISGYNNVLRSRQNVDDLNIFPVPDGDTGTNMSMTMSAAAREISALGEDATVSDVAQKSASALLRGARGNSGVILSLLFRGFAIGLKDLEEANGTDFANALTFGVEAAYKAVMKPTEGTILTVARVAAERACEFTSKDTDALKTFEIICKGAADALVTTPDLLPVLKKAGVVDAGGKGLLLIFEGMLSVFRDGVIIEASSQDAEETGSSMSAVAEYEGEITFTYCTEYIVGRESGSKSTPEKLRVFLEGIGDCVVVVDDEEIIKVHTHTDNPGKALQEGLKCGQLLTVKIENMREQKRAAKAVKPGLNVSSRLMNSALSRSRRVTDWKRCLRKSAVRTS